jgi:hypothetical protein
VKLPGCGSVLAMSSLQILPGEIVWKCHRLHLKIERAHT